MCSFIASLVSDLVIIRGFLMTPCGAFDVVHYVFMVSIVHTLQSFENIFFSAWMLFSHLEVLDNTLWAFRYHLVLPLKCSKVGHFRLP